MASTASRRNATTAKPQLCEGSRTFNPDTVLLDAAALDKAAAFLAENDLESAIKTYFGLAQDDKYVYHAITSVTLAQVQRVVNLGSANGLHDWYRDLESGAPLPLPPDQDVEAYISIFLPTTDTVSALRSLGANAKRGSIRASAADYLQSKRFIHPSLLSALSVPKVKAASKNKGTSPPSLTPQNPYLTFWAWSSRNLQWCGPSALSSSPAHQQSHHILPILMHHFGCAAPSHEALCILRTVAAGRRVVDMGAGNGYWTLMLRQYGVKVIPVDNAQSEWRTTWIRDVVKADGVSWLKSQTADNSLPANNPASRQGGGPDLVLLMVYPIVGGGVAGGEEGGFTRTLLHAYMGDTLAVVGTQNHNGYTSFRSLTMDEYMAQDHKEWTRVVQIPLPSFAGKDEALFVFQRGEKVPSNRKTNLADSTRSSSPNAESLR
jgi:hypothetical protein